MATIRIIKGRIYYHFRFKGVKCTEKSGLEDTKDNLKQAKKFVKLIDAEIANGIFEYEKHFPHGAKIEQFAPKREDKPFTSILPTGWRERFSRRRPGAIGRAPSGSTFTRSARIGSCPP